MTGALAVLAVLVVLVVLAVLVADLISVVVHSMAVILEVVLVECSNGMFG